MSSASSLWAIVLASDEVEPQRIVSTLDRLAWVVAPDHAVTVVDERHRRWAWQELAGKGSTIIVPQESRGTAIDLLIALRLVLGRDPGATVAVVPAEHGLPGKSLERALRSAYETVPSRPGSVVFAATPDEPSFEFGWIQPSASDGLARVLAFQEKPRAPFRGAMRGRLFAATLGTLLDLYERTVPDVVNGVGKALRAAEGDDGSARDAYRSIPKRDLSRDVLAPGVDTLSFLSVPDGERPLEHFSHESGGLDLPVIEAGHTGL
jgi:mannose-1-phosphate guanylyltransferase